MSSRFIFVKALQAHRVLAMYLTPVKKDYQVCLVSELFTAEAKTQLYER